MNKRDEQKTEAIQRMRAMQLIPNVIEEFRKKDTINYSERTRLGGILYYIDENNHPEWLKLIRQFEKENNALVYHVTHERISTPFETFETLSFLYVSQYKSEWHIDDEQLLQKKKNGEFEQLVYVRNLTYPELSEIEYAFFKNMSGGIIRVR